MSYRVQCSACGKTMTLEDDAEGELLVCVACGARLVAPPAPLVQAKVANDADGAEAEPDATEVPSAVSAAVPYATAATTARSGPTTARRASAKRGRPLVVAGVVALVVLLLASLVVVFLLVGRRGGHSAMAEDV
jgi:DNA-directed RNA polymerase subunit RPC12/RpoP